MDLVGLFDSWASVPGSLLHPAGSLWRPEFEETVLLKRRAWSVVTSSTTDRRFVGPSCRPIVSARRLGPSCQPNVSARRFGLSFRPVISARRFGPSFRPVILACRFGGLTAGRNGGIGPPSPRRRWSPSVVDGLVPTFRVEQFCDQNLKKTSI